MSLHKKTASGHGFSLIEVNLAILMVAVGLLALFALFPLGLRESEKGLADTQESMFADTVLSAMEGNAITLTNWATWQNSSVFYSAAVNGINIQAITTPLSDGSGWGLTNSPGISFPDGSGFTLRYSLSLSDVAPGRKRATLRVMHGKYGTFDQASVFFSEFVYLGM